MPFQRALIAPTLCLALFAAGCTNDEPIPAGSTGGSAGSGGADGVVRLAPSDDDTAALQTALVDARSDTTIELAPGIYRFTRKLTLSAVPGVTVRGGGASPDEVTLDFSGQTDGADAFGITADRFTLENLTVKDAPGNGVKVSLADRPTFRKVKAFWSAGSVTANGAYALYPAECTNVLIEDCEVSGAADAGIYLGQSSTGVVRRNKAHGNVIGIEAENSTDVELYDNEAWDNSCGMLIVNLPNLTKKTMLRADAHDNLLRDNNRPNFGTDEAFVSNIPPGTGIVLMGADDSRLRDNEIRGNEGTGALVVSWSVLALLAGENPNPDPAYDGFTETLYLSGNRFSGNGTNPQGTYKDDVKLTAPVEDILWDGSTDLNKDAGTAAQRRICIQQNGSATFRNLNAPQLLQNQTTDLTPHDCSYPALPAVTLPE
jgi:parallel beta-helix repeat protein